ncbi:serine hydrolase domain-containing protein [Nocardioides caldifontis]|uniref:serine hydrolase domain-containing protein n=1 Tax=Nocardioides caldifontis TaxID=2588938 RepID=UPI001EF0575D|nr:serine hydrolase domain-containing protein [Nocardioides caldifontis]
MGKPPAVLRGAPIDANQLTTYLRDHVAPPSAGAVVRNGGVVVATDRVDETADFEVGSVSKAVTGLLYADALDRGEVATDTTLGELLPLAGAPAAEVRLADLAVHRSGLPRLPAAMHPWRRTFVMLRDGTNPYGDTLAELLEQVRTAKVGRPRPAYSNLGFMLLGHAVAAAAGTTYRDLVRTRITEPLDLDGFYVAERVEQLSGKAVEGRSRRGRPRDPWVGEGLGPAGGIRATVTSVARLLAAVLDGTAPGTRALDPVAPLAGKAVRIGAGWVTLEKRGREIAWHNGGTGGFRSWVGVDRAAGTGAVVLSARTRSVDRAGLELLGRTTG